MPKPTASIIKGIAVLWLLLLLLPDLASPYLLPEATTKLRDQTPAVFHTKSGLYNRHDPPCHPAAGVNSRSRESQTGSVYGVGGVFGRRRRTVRMLEGTGTSGTAVVIEASKGVPRGPEGAIKLTYLEINSWMWQVNGLNLLVDPLFGTLDFGFPALIRGTKRVIRDNARAIRELSAVTDCLVISQGIDDHCHPPTIGALAGLLDPSVRVIAPPSAKGVLEEHFPASRITYLLPGESTVVSKDGRAVELRTTSGAVLGPPWQQAENGYIVRPAAADSGGKAPTGGSLYYEPHLMFDSSEVSELQADVVIAPVVEQKIAAYTLVAGGEKALKLASALKASMIVPMPNAEADFAGPLGNVVTEANTEQEFLELARKEGVKVVTAKAAERIDVWP